MRADAGDVRSAFGLRIGSAIDLPELALAPADGRPTDVDIVLGSVAERLAGSVEAPPLMQVSGERFQFNSPAGRFLVLDGRRIIVDPSPGASAAEIRLYLLGTVTGALLHQCERRLPLHAAVMAVGDGAAAFAGPSGAGKSTLAAQWLQAGRPVLADDLCAVEAGDGLSGGPAVYPGPARIKLWPDSLALAGVDGAGLPQLAPTVDKVSLATGASGEGPFPLRRLYVLRPDDAAETVGVRPLAGPEAVAAVVESVYRWPIAVAMGRAAAHWSTCVALVAGCRVFEVAYALDPQRPRHLAEALEVHIGRAV